MRCCIFAAILKTCILVTVTRTSRRIQNERSVLFRWQQWLRERVTLLRHTYVVCRVVLNLYLHSEEVLNAKAGGI